MKSIIKSIKIEKPRIKCKNKDRFIKIEKENDKTMYHTKIMMDIYKLGIDNKRNECRISLRTLFNQMKVEEVRLYSIKEGDKFLGIYYGYRKPIKNIFVKYEINGTIKSYGLSKAHYIEFRFKKGSVFCYFKGLFRLLKKEKENTPYNMACIDMFTKLEKHVYEFYGKKYPEKGIIIRWIEKNQK